MKARSFLSAVAAGLTALLLLAVGLLWVMDLRSPLHLAEQPLTLPRAALFVPREADLSLHWLADPGRRSHGRGIGGQAARIRKPVQ